MIETLVKFAIYVLAVFVGIFLFVIIGSEIFMQTVMLYEGVPERTFIPKESALVHIGLFLYIPEALFGAIAGWYFAEWLSEKIYNY